ncbi:Guanine nucleotide-binding protein, beta subunit [Parasponia andersonii]|uniref:tRNA (guanine-N(7)-)-methyltransferase non-catalytic subunit n=1 Tax=Parasponia andersonii TaxID=3476 RepID=A0A2P5C2I9_PARAD|nr:Guanine nucleotide-binding protein, beta subunit [Parasponia andersonii]
MEDASMEYGESNKDNEVAPALIAVHPTQESVAVAVGSELRVFDLRQGGAISLEDDSSSGSLHKDSIRAIRYGANGKLLVSAGDDKLVKIWSTESWRCITTVCSEKRVTAVAISHNGLYVCFADKFGVVWIVNLDMPDGQAAVNKKAAPLLSHYCSIITSLEFSPDGKFLVSADRDFKIRVTVFPKKPLDGAHEIQSFCLGHTEFVSCLSFVCSQEYPHGFLVSGSGDSTVRLWDISSGHLLDTCEVGEKAGLLVSNGREAECYSAVTDLCTNPDGSLVAVAVQRQVPDYVLQGIILLKCDHSGRTLSCAKVVSIGGGTFIPTSLRICSSTRLLWMVTGVSNLRVSEQPSSARVRVISGLTKSNDQHEPFVLEDNEVPAGAKLLEKLQGSLSYSEEVFLAAAEAVKTAMSNLLIKKQYSADKREFRKRTRNDKKIKQ